MRAALLEKSRLRTTEALRIPEVPMPHVLEGHVLLEVRACGVCRNGSSHSRGRIATHSSFPHSWSPDRRGDCRRPLQSIFRLTNEWVSRGLVEWMAHVSIAGKV